MIAAVQALGDGVTIARRNLTHVRHVPEKLLDVTFQPLIFVILFTYVFGSAIKVPGVSYHEYLMGGIFVQTVAFASMNTAISVADDMHKGVIERFRALPMARSAVLTGRTGADLAASVIALTVLTLTGLVTGWRINSPWWEAIGGFVLLLLFGYSMTWLGVLIGLVVRAPDAAQSIGFMVLFPLTFVANTFVPTEGMPRWLQAFANWNPISALATGCRELFGNQPDGMTPDVWPLQHAILVSFVWSFAIIAVCLPLAVRRYRTAYNR